MAKFQFRDTGDTYCISLYTASVRMPLAARDRNLNSKWLKQWEKDNIFHKMSQGQVAPVLINLPDVIKDSSSFHIFSFTSLMLAWFWFSN